MRGARKHEGRDKEKEDENGGQVAGRKKIRARRKEDEEDGQKRRKEELENDIGPR